MPACVSISKRFFALSVIVIVIVATVLLQGARAEEPLPPATEGRTVQPEEDDYKQTPYTSFGEFNDEDESEDTRFFQYGRFFGVSLGLGYEGATGNRGTLYTGGLPAFSVRMHYWFDFNFALTLGIYSAKHQYSGFKDTTGGTTGDKTNVDIFAMGSELRYYFDTRDATAPVTFAGPFLIVGVGSYAKSENDVSSPGTVAKDTALGISFGGGLEFPLKPRKSYLNLETKFHSIGFNDDGVQVTTSSGKVLKDSAGLLFTLMASVLFTY